MKRALIIESRSSAESEMFGLVEALSLTRYDLICIQGRDCSIWEDIVDETIIGANGNPEFLPITTSHPNETISEVASFASGFFKNEKVEIIHARI